MKELIGDYYSQIALLNSLKLKHIDKSDFKALQEALEGDKQYQLIFKTEYPIVVKRGLSLKLHKELLHYLELEKQEAQNSKDSSLDAITKMIEELKQDIKPVNKFFTNLDKTITPPPQKEDAIKQLSIQRALKGMQKAKKRPR
jgi:hypothetical protein